VKVTGVGFSRCPLVSFSGSKLLVERSFVPSTRSSKWERETKYSPFSEQDNCLDFIAVFHAVFGL
jgi:hypothetical protein